MCVLLEEKGYRLGAIRGLHRAYVRALLSHPRDAKGRVVPQYRQPAHPVTAEDPRRAVYRIRGWAEHRIDAELARLDREQREKQYAGPAASEP